MSELRAHLGEWLDRARQGHDVVVTDRGVPVARLVGIDGASTIERLTRQGVISTPERAERPLARGRRRVTPKGSLSDLVSEQRR
ncbi:MAG: type II toxin-antitoxin system prevent-host-death family antitoxin [Actinobacteria bacterium]|nr:type II toxin-antitoxin system prevent-host-death family antitoxin [Actinomycetota bacterium]